MAYPLDEAGRPQPASTFPLDHYSVRLVRRKFHDRVWLHVTLFVLTFLTTTLS